MCVPVEELDVTRAGLPARLGDARSSGACSGSPITNSVCPVCRLTPTRMATSAYLAITSSITSRGSQIAPAGSTLLGGLRWRHGVSAKVDYAIRAMVELAAAPPGTVKVERIATEQRIPRNFLENILLDLRHAELVTSRRGWRVATGLRDRLPRSASPTSSGPSRARLPACEACARTSWSTRVRPLLCATWIELRAPIRGVLQRRRWTTSSGARRARS